MYFSRMSPTIVLTIVLVEIYISVLSHRGLLDEICDDMFGEFSIVFKRQAVVDEPLIRKFSNICKSLVGFECILQPYRNLCVSPRLQEFIPNTNLRKIWKDSTTCKTSQEAFKKCPCLFSANQTRM